MHTNFSLTWLCHPTRQAIYISKYLVCRPPPLSFSPNLHRPTFCVFSCPRQQQWLNLLLLCVFYPQRLARSRPFAKGHRAMELLCSATSHVILIWLRWRSAAAKSLVYGSGISTVSGMSLQWFTDHFRASSRMLSLEIWLHVWNVLYVGLYVLLYMHYH